MNIVGMVSVLAGSIILLGLFLSVAYEGVRTKYTHGVRVPALNDKWQKLTVSAR